MARVLIGTSGWHYDSWRGPFFPKGLPLKSQLQFYASQFSSAELNGVFYRTPTPEAVESWRLQTGKDFVFAWKASKFITHWKRLSESSANSLELLENRLSLLGNKVGPILFQLPPNFRADADRLSEFFKMLSSKRRYSFEFRDPSWYAPRILKLLAESRPGGRYRGHYDDRTLTEWARRIRSWKKQGKDVYVYFDNDQKSAAPADALKLQRMLI